MLMKPAGISQQRFKFKVGEFRYVMSTKSFSSFGKNSLARESNLNYN